VIDLGTQVSTFQDKEIVARKLNLAWELYCDRMEDGRPFMVSERYTMSLHEKSSLHKMLSAWLGKEFQDAAASGVFNFNRLLGRPCLVTVVHMVSRTGNPFAKIRGVTVLPRGLQPDEQVNPSVLFDLSGPDMKVFDSLPIWQREEIAKSPEWQAKYPGQRREDSHEDDSGIPF
jgi:hypothetical protein